MRVSRDWFAVFAKLFVVPLLVPVPPFSVPYLYTGINSPVDDTMIYPNTDSVNIYLIYSIKKLLCYYGILYAIICEIVKFILFTLVNCEMYSVADPDPVRLKNVPPKLFRWKSVVTVLEREHTHCSEEAVDLEKKLHRLRRGFWSFKPFGADFSSTKNFKFCFGI